MKLAEINMAVGILAGTKLNKITDKRVKSTLLNDYLNMRRLVKGAEADRQELISKFQEDWKDEIQAVEELRLAHRKVVGHDAFLDAELDTNRAISDIFASEVEVDIKAVGMDDFLSNCGGDELTLEEVAYLEEVGIITA